MLHERSKITLNTVNHSRPAQPGRFYIAGKPQMYLSRILLVEKNNINFVSTQVKNLFKCSDFPKGKLSSASIVDFCIKSRQTDPNFRSNFFLG